MFLIAVQLLPSNGRSILVQALRAAYSSASSENIIYPTFKTNFQEDSPLTVQSFVVDSSNFADLAGECSNTIAFPLFSQIQKNSSLDVLLTEKCDLKIGTLEGQNIDFSTFNYELGVFKQLIDVMKKHYNSTVETSYDITFGEKSFSNFDFVYAIPDSDEFNDYYPACSVLPNYMGVLGVSLGTPAAKCISLDDYKLKTFVQLENSKYEEIVNDNDYKTIAVYSPDSVVAELLNQPERLTFGDFYQLRAAQIKNPALQLIEVCEDLIKSNYYIEQQRFLLLPDTEIPASIVEEQLLQKLHKSYYNIKYGEFYGNNELKRVLQNSFERIVTGNFSVEFPFTQRKQPIATLEQLTEAEFSTSFTPLTIQEENFSIIDGSLLSEIEAFERIRISNFEDIKIVDFAYADLSVAADINYYILNLLQAQLSHLLGVRIRVEMMAFDGNVAELLTQFNRFSSLKTTPPSSHFDFIYRLNASQTANYGAAFLSIPFRAVSVEEVTNFQSLINVNLVYCEKQSISCEFLQNNGAKFQSCDSDEDCLKLLGEDQENAYLTLSTLKTSNFKLNIMPERENQVFAVNFDDSEIQGVMDVLGRAIGVIALLVTSIGLFATVWGIYKVGIARKS